jgi:hypothetical protein
VWIDVDSSAVPNNPVVIAGSPMKKQDNPTEFVISAIKSEHITWYRLSFEPAMTWFKFKHVFMCNDCQVYVGDRVIFTGTMPGCVPAQTGALGSRTGVSLNTIYYVVAIVRKYNPMDTFTPEGFQIAYTQNGATVTHPNDAGANGGEDAFVNSPNTAMVTVGNCDAKTQLTSTTPNGADPPPLYTYNQGSGDLQGPKTLGCECSTSNNLKMRILRVNAAGGAYIYEKISDTWRFRSRLSIPGPFTPLVSNMLWEKSYFGKSRVRISYTPSKLSESGAAVSISAKHKLAFVGCPG